MAITLGQLIKNKRSELGSSIIEAAKKIDVSEWKMFRWKSYYIPLLKQNFKIEYILIYVIMIKMESN